jgi:homogentisate 1,2-dioxygenase
MPMKWFSSTKEKEKLRTMLGNIPLVWRLSNYSTRNYIQIEFDTDDNRLFYVESFAPFYTQNVIKRIE